MEKNILKFKTSINCGGCIAKVTPYLDSVKGITKWEVDRTDKIKYCLLYLMRLWNQTLSMLFSKQDLK